jgi:hypothetical protein
MSHHHESLYNYSEGIKVMLGFLVDNISVVVRNQVFQQSIGIRMETNYAS